MRHRLLIDPATFSSCLIDQSFIYLFIHLSLGDIVVIFFADFMIMTSICLFMRDVVVDYCVCYI